MTIKKEAFTAFLVLATCGAMTPAHAQSSVTLYGILDVGIEHLNNAPGGSVTRETSGNLMASRWGLRIKEDLGDGLTAIAVLEAGMNLNDGTATLSTKGLGANAATTSRMFGRQSFVGLSKYGQQVTLGRHTTPLFDFVVAYDPTTISGKYSVLSLDASLSSRADDSIKYIGHFGDFNVEGLYSTRYDVGYGDVVPGAQLTGREYGAIAGYAAGPLSASILWDQRNSNTPGTNTAIERRMMAAVKYAFGVVDGYIGYRFLRADAAFLPASLFFRAPGAKAAYSSIFWAGVVYHIAPDFQVTAAAYHEAQHATSSDPSLGVVIVDYFLSKRTDLFGNVGYSWGNKNGSTFGLNGFGTATPDHNQLGLVVGIRHKF